MLCPESGSFAHSFWPPGILGIPPHLWDQGEVRRSNEVIGGTRRREIPLVSHLIELRCRNTESGQGIPLFGDPAFNRPDRDVGLLRNLLGQQNVFANTKSIFRFDISIACEETCVIVCMHTGSPVLLIAVSPSGLLSPKCVVLGDVFNMCIIPC
jgi:hypothetical protein